MNMKDSHTLTSQPSEENVTSESGSEAVSTEAPTREQIEREVLNKIYGESITSLDEAKKKYDNLTSLVGDQEVAAQRKDSELMSSLVNQISLENNVSKDAARDYIMSLSRGEQANLQQTNESNKSNSMADSIARDEIQSLRFDVQKGDLLKKYPQAEKYVDAVKSFAKAENLDMVQAFEKGWKPETADEKASDKQKQSAQITMGGKQNVAASDRLSVEEFKKLPYDKAQKYMQGLPAWKNKENLY